MRDPKAYWKKVESCVEKYASQEDADNAGETGDEPMSRSHRDRKATNGNGATGNGHSNGHDDADGEDEDDDMSDKMSDMGELSDGDEFMGEMDD